MKHALLAEDDPVSRNFLSEALALSGWMVTAFERGEDAAEAAIARRFDVLILDLNLPGEDGVQTLRRIRNRDDHASAEAPALALTADHRPERHAQLRRNGFDAVAVKPLSLAGLEAALAGLVRAELTVGGATTQPSPACEPLPVWDDAAGLVVVGGRMETLEALRKLLLGDLPAQHDAVLENPTSAIAAATLHRLRAACGFCGAAQLAQAVAELEACAPEQRNGEVLERFAHSAAQTLATPWKQESRPASAPADDAHPARGT